MKSERRRVLVVDDEPGICRALVRALEPLYSVDTLVDPFEALERLTIWVQPYAAIIMDVGLHRMSGIEVYERAIFIRPELAPRFLFMSGNGSDEAIAFLERADISSVRKPFDKEQLHAKLALVMQTWG